MRKIYCYNFTNNVIYTQGRMSKTEIKHLEAQWGKLLWVTTE